MKLRGGPGLLVAAAFVGPGTIATASSAGATFGYTLVWALAFSVLATIVLQEMAVRQALVTRQGLATTLRRSFSGSWLGRVAVLLIVAAVGIGNAAYESGNITGAALALQGIGLAGHGVWAVVIGAAAAGLIFLPAYRQLERVLIGLVMLMSLVFIFCAISLSPDWSALASAAIRPSIPAGGLTTVIALIGTTVVPYNLFLQANAVREKWPGSVPLPQALAEARGDTVLSVVLGGLITLAILSTTATLYFGTEGSFTIETLAAQLEPVLGPAGRYLFALGLLAAGLTSAVTAPLAAAYAVCGALGWENSLRSARFRGVALAVVATGTFFAATGTRPIAAIIFAQAANGLLLPFVALALLYLMNQRALLGDSRNGWAGNTAAGALVVITLVLGATKLASLLPD